MEYLLLFNFSVVFNFLSQFNQITNKWLSSCNLLPFSSLILNFKIQIYKNRLLHNQVAGSSSKKRRLLVHCLNLKKEKRNDHSSVAYHLRGLEPTATQEITK
jgi:hypothetical protein